MHTMLYRLKLGKQRQCIQDYIVTPDQLWLDGIATGDGYVQQFVAMPLGTGYSVVYQVTGEDILGGLQFEVTPSVPCKPVVPQALPALSNQRDASGRFEIGIKMADGSGIALRVKDSTTVKRLIDLVAYKEDIRPSQLRLLFAGRRMAEGETLSDHEIGPVSLPHVVIVDDMANNCRPTACTCTASSLVGAVTPELLRWALYQAASSSSLSNGIRTLRRNGTSPPR